MEKEIEKKINKSFIREGAKKIRPEDVEIVAKRRKEIEEKFKNENALQKFFKEVKTFLDIVVDFYKGNYREIPYWSIAAIVFALLYVLNPMDLIPDYIPVVGYVDDALVISVCMLMVEQDVKKYREWKENQSA